MRSDRRPLLLSVLGLVVLLSLGADAARRFRVDTSMDHFLPSSGERKLYRISRKLIDSRLTSRMTLTLGLDSDELERDERRTLLANAARTFGDELKKSSGIESVTQGPPKGIEESFFDLYFPRRFAFSSMDPESDAKSRFSTSRLESDAKRLKDQLASPEGVLIRSLAPKDPWLLFSDFLTQVGESSGRLDIHEGQFFAPVVPGHDQQTSDFAVLFIKLRDSALDATAQAPVLSHLESSLQRVRQEIGHDLRLEASGANRFAVATEASMRSDIERVFALSTVGLLLLFLLFFRSASRLVFLVAPIVSGLVVALWATLIFVGSIHALTLAFGGALIGIAIDYPVHILCHHELIGHGEAGRVTARRLLPTLGLAAGTTLLGLVGLAWAGFPGIREIALFSSVGVATALMTTVLGARLLPPQGPPARLPVRAAEVLSKALFGLRQRRWLTRVLLGAAVCLSALSVPLLRFAPGLESLAPLDAELLREDERVQKRVGQGDGGTLAITLGPNLENALIENEEVLEVLERAKGDGVLNRFDSVSMLLRSASLQGEAQRMWSRSPHLVRRTLDALEGAGFVRSAFPDLQDELDRPVSPLALEDIEASPLAPLVEPFVLSLESEVAVVTPLSGVKDSAALRARLEGNPSVHYFSQKSLLDGAYGDLRRRTTELLLLGLLLVFAAALLRYRSWKTAVALLLPATLAAGGTVGALSALGMQLNILHLLGLLLVCSMGVDYSVFLLDSPDDPRPALLSITIGCLSTMLSFGALALSSAPALRALGVTIAVGILLSLVLAPTVWIVLPPRRPQPEGG